MSLTDALADIKNDVAAGDDFDTAVQAAADEYGLNPKLLARKVQENGWTVEGLRATANATNASKVFAEKVARVTQQYFDRYQPTGRTHGTVFVWQGVTYTYIGSRGANEHVCVRHSDGTGRVLNTPALMDSTFQAEASKR